MTYSQGAASALGKPPASKKAAVKRLCRGRDTLLSRRGRAQRCASPIAAIRGDFEVRGRALWTARDQVSGTFMPQKVRIALDAMGGDVGASVVIPGAAISLTLPPHADFLLFSAPPFIDPHPPHYPPMK